MSITQSFLKITIASSPLSRICTAPSFVA
ncbi:hypothetical protein PMIN01_11930 [Paraphaeosphaeria minitans]|uniref:Uncharacterized protein n=1 Tax=Paraphaeosphaeria minitans TaxID=565426 RepID=A0A9P6KJC8_9PLEO|nr:hypothetical protein PMIN01_13544 [Paraphaeosphaeria minitans]KAF9729997.1 hypothetical protein PMIN01_11930 [Paraphaeosphaeria minitans]